MTVTQPEPICPSSRRRDFRECLCYDSRSGWWRRGVAGGGKVQQLRHDGPPQAGRALAGLEEWPRSELSAQPRFRPLSPGWVQSTAAGAGPGPGAAVSPSVLPGGSKARGAGSGDPQCWCGLNYTPPVVVLTLRTSEVRPLQTSLVKMWSSWNRCPQRAQCGEDGPAVMG